MFFTLVLLLSVACASSYNRRLYGEIGNATATGYRAFIEEYRYDLLHPDYQPSEQHTSSIIQSEVILKDHDLNLNQPKLSQYCRQSLPKRFGLLEFSDFGPLNNLPWNDVFVVSPGYPHITGKAHFAFLDAYGGRLKGDTLEVLVSDQDEGQSGLRTKEGKLVTSLLMHYEASSYGYGRGDSQALAPPLQVSAVTRRELGRELAALARTSRCYCDVLAPAPLVYALGLYYYPQYGHTVFNGLSNFVATLWRKNISYDNVEFSPYLYRNTSTLVENIPSRTYQLKWFDMYNELFSFYSSSVALWTEILDFTQRENRTICFERVMVGALPHLDHMNISVPSEMWDRFGLNIMAHFYWEELKKVAVGDTSSSPHDTTLDQLRSLSPTIYPNYHKELEEEVYDDANASAWKARAVTPYCAVTIITRDVFNARSIVNANELAAFAVAKGCRAQVIALERLGLKYQIGEVRWNTTLLVSVDGTALMNALFMQECSTVLFVELWRRKMMIPRFGPSAWAGYSPLARDTSFPNASDPIACHLRDLIQSHSSSGRQSDLESMSLASLPFPRKNVEDFLRNGQATYVKLVEFERILDDSIKHNLQCRRTNRDGNFKHKSSTMKFKIARHRNKR